MATLTALDVALTLPRDLADDLVAPGCFRALVPRSHGGEEATPADFLLWPPRPPASADRTPAPKER